MIADQITKYHNYHSRLLVPFGDDFRTINIRLIESIYIDIWRQRNGYFVWRIDLLRDHYTIGDLKSAPLQTNKENFMSYVKVADPTGFLWLLWHPEILEGKYNV